jgi:hypothetical protein
VKVLTVTELSLEKRSGYFLTKSLKMVMFDCAARTLARSVPAAIAGDAAQRKVETTASKAAGRLAVARDDEKSLESIVDPVLNVRREDQERVDQELAVPRRAEGARQVAATWRSR